MLLTKVTKTAFKQLHKGGELVLIAGGVKGNVKEVATMIQTKLDDGVNLADYGRNVSAHGFIDNNEHAVFESEENGLVFLENTWTEPQNDNRTLSYTTVYQVR